jgi:hypothetical protein
VDSTKLALALQKAEGPAEAVDFVERISSVGALVASDNPGEVAAAAHEGG